MNEHIDIQNGNSQKTITDYKTNRKHKKLKRVIVVLSICLALFIAVFSAIPPLVMGDMINSHINFKTTYSADQFGITSGNMKLTTSDGLKIAAYEVFKPSPKAVVIFLSGIQNPSVTAFFGHAALLQKNGYASILCEMRAHGESEGDVICVGYKEYLDVKAVVEYIKSNDKYKNVPVVVYGFSMGGAAAINAVGEIPEIDGLVSMSAFSSWEDTFCDNMANMGMPKFICDVEKPFVKIYSGFKYGFNSINISPKNEIKKLGDRPALLYHSKEDSQIPFSSFERIIKNAPEEVETWVKDGDFHFPTVSFDRPEDDTEYSKLLISFLDRHFAK